MNAAAGSWHPDPRLTALGWRGVFPTIAVGDGSSPESLRRTDDTSAMTSSSEAFKAYRRWRYFNGVAEGEEEIETGTAVLPHMMALPLVTLVVHKTTLYSKHVILRQVLLYCPTGHVLITLDDLFNPSSHFPHHISATTSFHHVPLSLSLPTDRSVPLEYNLDALNGVSYKKGCYVGQERVSFSHYRGVTRRRCMPFTVTSGSGGCENKC